MAGQEVEMVGSWPPLSSAALTSAEYEVEGEFVD
jgi:hypothetical protein